MLKKIYKQIYHKKWEEFLGSPVQSWAWGEVKHAYGWDVERFAVYKENEIVSVVSVLLRRFPLSSFVSLLGFKQFAYIPRGFAVKDEKYFKTALKSLEEYYKDKAAFIIIDPDRPFGTNKWNESFKSALDELEWAKSGVSIQPNQTNVIDIKRSEKELISSFRPKWRRNLRKAQRQGVRVYEAKDKDGVSDFYQVISSVERSTKFVAHSEEYFLKMWEEMKKDGLIRIFIAERKSELLSAYLVLVNKDAGFEVFGGSTKIGRDLEASYLLKLEIMCRLSEDGKQFYDQWGVAPKGEENHPLSGISYYKSGFGGAYVDFLPQYVKIFNKIGYLLYKMFKRD